MNLAYMLSLAFFLCVCLFDVKHNATVNGSELNILKLINEEDRHDSTQESKYVVHKDHAGEATSIISLLETRPTENGNQSSSNDSTLDGSKRKLMKSRRKGKKQRKSLTNQESCPTQTVVSMKKTAEDVFGITVDVHPFIVVSNLQLDQIFYETFCETENCKCGGLSKRYSESRCHTTYTHVYARIIKSGEAGWGLIKVRSGCACILQ